MIRLLITTVLCAAFATQSVALSCLRPDPIETFKRLAAAEESYFVLRGTLTFDEAALPPSVGDNDMAQPDPIPGFFVGSGLSKQGFTTDYVGNVLLQVNCAGPWCGSARSNVEAVWFVPFSDPPAILQADPCGSMTFFEPTDAVVTMLESCMADGTCVPVSE
ncbi:hypothetical protein [Yoonia litorea]|uniref:Uncharacterized protein n=1 Tax=Yoonia litorea TaxID=1123755 RepID=A0A1I6MZF2_9RHOB|nr:hypothetical protein [Yoonia litorea]SFS21027.1 hypothetical protein SAMN05444714_2719 [Yoonia litorea]